MSPLSNLFLILAPVVIGGVLNMVFVKTPVLHTLAVPIDKGKTLGDGHRLFGDNKTWKGFWGMIIFTGIATWLLLQYATPVYRSINSALVPPPDSSWWLPFGYGAVLGLFYVLFELPNSFIKRRIGIAPGKNGQGMVKYLFVFIDQADSVLGCALALLLFCNISVPDFFMLIFIGTAVHYFVNLLLYLGKLKSQAG